MKPVFHFTYEKDWRTAPVAFWVHVPVPGSVDICDPPAPLATPHRGYAFLRVEFGSHELQFSALAQLDHFMDVLSRSPLPTSRQLSSGRGLPVGPNGHWLSRLPAELKSPRKRKKLVDALSAVRQQVVEHWSDFSSQREESLLMHSKKTVPSVRMRILLVEPPPGVRFAVQRGRSELLEPLAKQHEAIWFEFSLRLGPPLPDGSANFLGEFAQGPPSDRFVYINSGTLAGQADACWTRRAKLKLGSIPRQVVETARSASDGIIEARVLGTLADGSPVCASVKPQAVVWRFVQDLG